MSDFKIGDKIKGLPGNGYSITTESATMEVIDPDSEGRMRVRVLAHTSRPSEVGATYYVSNSKKNFELISGESTVTGRRTFKLIKATAELKAGATVQERCDDGDQDYTVLDTSFVKYENESGSKSYTLPRGAVENEPKWFVEVFKVTPEYMTREELDQWEAFKAQRSTKSKGVKAKAVAPVVAKTSGHAWTPAQRKAHSAKMKAHWAAKKAA